MSRRPNWWSTHTNRLKVITLSQVVSWLSNAEVGLPPSLPSSLLILSVSSIDSPSVRATGYQFFADNFLPSNFRMICSTSGGILSMVSAEIKETQSQWYMYKKNMLQVKFDFRLIKKNLLGYYILRWCSSIKKHHTVASVDTHPLECTGVFPQSPLMN